MTLGINYNDNGACISHHRGFEKKITGDPKWVHSAPGIMEPPVSISNHEVRNKKYDLTGPITTH